MTSDFHGQRVKVDNLFDVFDGANTLGRFIPTDGYNSLIFGKDGTLRIVDNGTYVSGDGTVLPVLRAFANVAASTTDGTFTLPDGTTLSSTSGYAVRVLAIGAVAGATATNLTFNSKGSGAGTAISPLFANAANGGEILPDNPRGWFQTKTGETLTVTTGTGATTGILVVCVKVPAIV